MDTNETRTTEQENTPDANAGNADLGKVLLEQIKNIKYCAKHDPYDALDNAIECSEVVAKICSLILAIRQSGDVCPNALCPHSAHCHPSTKEVSQ